MLVFKLQVGLISESFWGKIGTIRELVRGTETRKLSKSHKPLLVQSHTEMCSHEVGLEQTNAVEEKKSWLSSTLPSRLGDAR